MSYRRRYHERIAVHYSGSISYSYPASQNGGSGTASYSGTVYEDVTVNIDVDTDPFDRSVAGCNTSINTLTAIVGTFNTPSVRIAQTISLLLPSAFSIEKILVAANAKRYNLSLADLGALYKGLPQAVNSGKIEMNTETDEVKSTLANEEIQKTLRSYTVIGKVLAADLLDTDKFQNHFLLTAASLGTQLLKTYDMGIDKDGKPATLTLDKIRDFFFNILAGKIKIQTMDGKFDISQITGRL